MLHTHTLPKAELFACNEGEVRMNGGMKMSWKWKWNERLFSRDTRGTQKKRERASTHTNTPGPERANPERAREKKSGGRRTRKKTSRGGERTEAPEPTYHSETYAYRGTHRTQPTWGGKNAWNRGQNGELVGEEEWSNKILNFSSNLEIARYSLKRDRCPSGHMGIKQLFRFGWIKCTACFTSPNTKETIPAGRGHACCLMDMLHCKQLEQRKKGSLW